MRGDEQVTVIIISRLIISRLQCQVVVVVATRQLTWSLCDTKRKKYNIIVNTASMVSASIHTYIIWLHDMLRKLLAVCSMISTYTVYSSTKNGSVQNTLHPKSMSAQRTVIIFLFVLLHINRLAASNTVVDC